MLKKILISLFLVSTFNFACTDDSIHNTVQSAINKKFLVFKQGQIYAKDFFWEEGNAPTKKVVLLMINHYTNQHYPSYDSYNLYDYSTGKIIATIPQNKKVENIILY